jgi:dTDP-glucose 4,6-dehydratase
MLNNMLEEKPLPIYGDGRHIRDWIYVEDHIAGIWTILKKGDAGESYNIGGETPYENKELVNLLCEIVAEETGVNPNKFKGLIRYVKDRQGHDRRYGINCSKIKTELGWKQKYSFKEGLKKTVRWYLKNNLWVKKVKSDEYLKWVEKNYEKK